MFAGALVLSFGGFDDGEGKRWTVVSITASRPGRTLDLPQCSEAYVRPLCRNLSSARPECRCRIVTQVHTLFLVRMLNQHFAKQLFHVRLKQRACGSREPVNELGKTGMFLKL